MVPRFGQNPGDLPQDVLEGLEQFLSEQVPEAYIACKNNRATPAQHEALARVAGFLLEEYRQELGDEQPIMGIVITRGK
jgi:hypothetical protein